MMYSPSAEQLPLSFCTTVLQSYKLLQHLPMCISQNETCLPAVNALFKTSLHFNIFKQMVRDN
jgi:hypothetical protein